MELFLQQNTNFECFDTMLLQFKILKIHQNKKAKDFLIYIYNTIKKTCFQKLVIQIQPCSKAEKNNKT